MEVGDKVAKVADALAIPKCEGCKKRQRFLNEMGRRGFIGGMSFAAGYAMLSAKMAVARTLAGPDENFALFLCRAINSIEVAWYNEHNQQWGDKTAIIGTYNSGLTNVKQRHEEMHRKGHKESNEATMNWAITLNLDPNSDEIMPGWKWDFALKPDGYIVVVAAIPKEKGERVPVYATDEKAIIYRADLADVPKASKLVHAESLPYASSWNKHLGDERITVFGRLLRALGIPVVVLAQLGNCGDCCIVEFGGTACSLGRPPAGTCAFNCGTQYCPWCVTGGTTTRCTCCYWACACNGGGSCTCGSCCGSPCQDC
jgi:hypothetical protein